MARCVKVAFGLLGKYMHATSAATGTGLLPFYAYPLLGPKCPLFGPIYPHDSRLRWQSKAQGRLQAAQQQLEKLRGRFLQNLRSLWHSGNLTLQVMCLGARKVSSGALSNAVLGTE